MKKILVETEACKKYCSENDGVDKNIGINEYNKDYLTNVGITHVVGWYGTGYYEGAGDALVRFDDGTFALKNLGHCSCYGPWEEADELKHLPFEEVKAKVLANPEYWEDIKPIFDAMEGVINAN